MNVQNFIRKTTQLINFLRITTRRTTLKHLRRSSRQTFPSVARTHYDSLQRETWHQPEISQNIQQRVFDKLQVTRLICIHISDVVNEILQHILLIRFDNFYSRFKSHILCRFQGVERMEPTQPHFNNPSSRLRISRIFASF